MESELSELLKPWGTEFGLNTKVPSTADIIKNLLDYRLVDRDHKQEQTAHQYGSGFQRHFIYSLIQLSAKYVTKRSASKKKEFDPDLNLLLFEEPEAFLHPPQQESLSRSLQHLANATGRQVICSTHSPHFVSRTIANITSIIRLSRNEGEIECYQISDEKMKEIIDANQMITNIAEKWPDLKKRLSSDDVQSEMESVKYCLWLNADRCSAFFANLVLLVEGPTEQSFLPRLMEDGHLPVPDHGVFIHDCIGKFNIHRFMHLFSGLGIPHAILYDDDNHKKHHKDLSQLILDSKDAKFTKAIVAIPKDLETALDIEPTAKHRKPQHVMFQYENGNIDADKLKDFCNLVEPCITTT